MAFKAFGMEQHIASRRSLPPLLAAVHFNYVVGNDEKRRWAKSAGLWFADEDSLQLPTESTLSIHHDGLADFILEQPTALPPPGEGMVLHYSEPRSLPARNWVVGAA